MSDQDTLKVGVVISPDYHQINQLVEFSPIFDELGYHQISVPEIWGRDAISFLGALASKTKKVKISTGIISMFSRTPALIGMTAATLDELSNGRFILGLGLSGPKVIENWHGMKYLKPLQRTEEFVSILRAIFNKDRVNFETSQLGTLKGFRISNPTVRSDIPIHIASLGPKNIALTAKIADGWIPIFMPEEMFKKEISHMKELVNGNGRNFNKFDITPFIPTIIGEEERQKDLLKGHLGYYFGGMGTFYNNLLKRMGFEDEAIEIMDHYAKGDILSGNRAVTDEIIEAVCIFGKKEDAIEKLIKFVKAGITCPILALPFRSTLEDARDTYQALSPKAFSM